MSAAVKLLLYLLGAFAFAAVLGPLFIKLFTKTKAEQNILGYVTQHGDKAGTPTMGGWIFVVPICVLSLVACKSFSLVAAAAVFAYAALGFLDDFIKVKYERNLGLKAYQKVIGQVGAALIIAVFCYKSGYIGTTVKFPFVPYEINVGWGIIPFVVLIYVATTNAVNLTDGLDGLAGYTALAYFLTFSLLLFASYTAAVRGGEAEYAEELFSLCVVSVSVFGAAAGYLLYNSYPAKIFMGDTGSLALGAAAATVAVFSKNPFLIPVAGIMYVISCISVILQVCSFKLRKKRVFLMSPFHHHLEMKGWHETKITSLYFTIGLIAGALTLIISGAV